NIRHNIRHAKVSDQENFVVTKFFFVDSYAAPELAGPNPTTKVDVFSFALILWEIDNEEEAWVAEGFTKSWQIFDSIANGKRPVVKGDLCFLFVTLVLTLVLTMHSDSNFFKSVIPKC